MQSGLLVLCATALIFVGAESVVGTLQPIPTTKGVALYVLQRTGLQYTDMSMVYNDTTKLIVVEPVALCPFAASCFGVPSMSRAPIFMIPTNAEDIRVQGPGEAEFEVARPKASGVFIQKIKDDLPSNEFEEAPGYSTGNIKILKLRLFNLEGLPETKNPEYASERLSPYAKYLSRPAAEDTSGTFGLEKFQLREVGTVGEKRHSPEIQEMGFSLRQVQNGKDVTYEKHTVFAIPSHETLTFCFGLSYGEFYNVRNHKDICYNPPTKIPYQELEIPGDHLLHGVFYGDPTDSDKGAIIDAIYSSKKSVTSRALDKREKKVVRRMRRKFRENRPVRSHTFPQYTSQEV